MGAGEGNIFMPQTEHFSLFLLETADLEAAGNFYPPPCRIGLIVGDQLFEKRRGVCEPSPSRTLRKRKHILNLAQTTDCIDRPGYFFLFRLMATSHCNIVLLLKKKLP